MRSYDTKDVIYEAKERSLKSGIGLSKKAYCCLG